MPLVIDASVTMAWCFEDEMTPLADAILERLQQEVAVVPDLWHLEIANVLLVAGRKGRISEAHTERFLALLSQLPIETATAGIEVSSVLDLGRRYSLSAYDAEYLLLAQMLGAELATLDQSLAAAGVATGLVVTS